MHHLNINGREMPLQLRRNALAKRLVLRLSRDGACVQITLPRRCSEKKALAFAQTQIEWIHQQLAKKPAPIAFTCGTELSLLGEFLTFKHHAKRLTKREGDVVYIGGDIEFFNRRMTDYIKKQAQAKFSEWACDFAEQIDEKVAGLRLRDTKSRWGSCSSDRRINISWRLALAPLETARYVVAHEVAHLKHFDHSPAFWALVTQMMPQWKLQRDWLRENGAILHSYGK